MLHRQVPIIDNEHIAFGYFLMSFSSPEIAQNSSPGQFIHIKCSQNHNPILRRPFSIHRVIKNKHIEILYKVVGKGTHWLSERKKGEKLDCLGSLGNGFRLPEFRSQKTENRKILVAGGIGIAPLIFLAEQLTKTPARFRKAGRDNPLRNSMEFQGPKSRKSERFLGGNPITVFIGAKTKNELLCVNELKKLGVKLHISTEDGSLGYKGLVTELLKKNLSTLYSLPRASEASFRGLLVPNRVYSGSGLSTSIYACGPKGMLEEVAFLSKKYKIPCQVSFEQFMGCGIGICNACVIKTKHGYKKVCKDGPVFDAEEIDWKKI